MSNVGQNWHKDNKHFRRARTAAFADFAGLTTKEYA